MDLITCSKCGFVGEKDFFKKDSTKPLGVQQQCMACRRKYKNQYQQIAHVRDQKNKRKADLTSLTPLTKKLLIAMFWKCCAKCGLGDGLTLDHHIPYFHGGRMTLNNLVALCSTCNGKKGKMHPGYFYSDEELLKIHLILKRQEDFGIDLSRG